MKQNAVRVRQPDWDGLTFKFSPTDFVYRAYGRVVSGGEWSMGEFLPFEPMPISPAAAVFSYGLGIFEGLKAQRAVDGRVLLFRPRDNARRFARSAARLFLPPYPEESFVAAVVGLVQRNWRFVPPCGKGTFYVRPMQHGIDPQLGLRAASSCWALMFGCPVGALFPSSAGGPRGLRLKVVEQARCASGGTGAAKAMGNYANGIAVARPWKERGYDDVLYLDARELRFLTETSGANVFVRLATGTLVTPPLDDQILAGITRDSVIRLAREVLGVTVEERPISVEEALDAGDEVFCTGTAYTVQGVGELAYRERTRHYGAGQLQHAIRDELLDIQRGARPDRFGWVTEVQPDARWSDVAEKDRTTGTERSRA